jgi:hypothetical protein
MVVEMSPAVYRREDGAFVSGVNKIVSREVFDQYREGIRCIVCDFVQSSAFPEQCENEGHAVTAELGVVDWRCQNMMRRDQAAAVQREFEGYWTAPEPAENLIDYEQEQWVEKGGILVPRDAAS